MRVRVRVRVRGRVRVSAVVDGGVAPCPLLTEELVYEPLRGG